MAVTSVLFLNRHFATTVRFPLGRISATSSTTLVGLCDLFRRPCGASYFCFTRCSICLPPGPFLHFVVTVLGHQLSGSWPSCSLCELQVTAKTPEPTQYKHEVFHCFSGAQLDMDDIKHNFCKHFVIGVPQHFVLLFTSLHLPIDGRPTCPEHFTAAWSSHTPSFRLQHLRLSSQLEDSWPHDVSDPDTCTRCSVHSVAHPSLFTTNTSFWHLGSQHRAVIPCDIHLNHSEHRLTVALRPPRFATSFRGSSSLRCAPPSFRTCFKITGVPMLCSRPCDARIWRLSFVMIFSSLDVCSNSSIAS